MNIISQFSLRNLITLLIIEHYNRSIRSSKEIFCYCLQVPAHFHKLKKWCLHLPSRRTTRMKGRVENLTWVALSDDATVWVTIRFYYFNDCSWLNNISSWNGLLQVSARRTAFDTITMLFDTEWQLDWGSWGEIRFLSRVHLLHGKNRWLC